MRHHGNPSDCCSMPSGSEIAVRSPMTCSAYKLASTTPYSVWDMASLPASADRCIRVRGQGRHRRRACSRNTSERSLAKHRSAACSTVLTPRGHAWDVPTLVAPSTPPSPRSTCSSRIGPSMPCCASGVPLPRSMTPTGVPRSCVRSTRSSCPASVLRPMRPYLWLRPWRATP
jgi:hypothetical protein